MASEEFDLDRLTLTDNYLFITVFSDPERCRKLLERILGFPIRRVVITEGEKTVVPGYQAHGIRMDVYAEDDDRTVYDIEMQPTKHKELGLRSRYYQSSIDQACIKRGELC